MFDRILMHVRNKELLFYWNSNYNMFKTLKNNQLNAMSEELTSIRINLYKLGNHDVLINLLCKYVISNVDRKIFFNVCNTYSYNFLFSTYKMYAENDFTVIISALVYFIDSSCRKNIVRNTCRKDCSNTRVITEFISRLDH